MRFYMAVVTFICTTANTFLLPKLFLTVYREEKWTVGKRIDPYVLATLFPLPLATGC